MRRRGGEGKRNFHLPYQRAGRCSPQGSINMRKGHRAEIACKSRLPSLFGGLVEERMNPSIKLGSGVEAGGLGGTSEKGSEWAKSTQKGGAAIQVWGTARLFQ